MDLTPQSLARAGIQHVVYGSSIAPGSVSENDGLRMLQAAVGLEHET